MNLKHFTFVTLLVCFLFSRGKCKQHIISINDGCCHTPNDQLPAILEAKWLPNSQLSVLIQSPRFLTLQCPNSPMAVGHFTFDDHQGHSNRFSHHPNYVNGFNDDNVWCINNYHIGDNPYNFIVSYDPNNTPAQGSTVTIALSIYYFCFHDGQTKCNSCDVKLDVGYP
ncbi:hypothetical protein F8M41_011101 [Gigaspora margarita]|uniref:Uncharacterized protein n=1 Tax=Gigaspora margarita TaxID=4874 RepID=A0A8H4AU52_GIGMA|nr:hypothetical protein F8M41_011101 [Gigaspora margarita]